MHDQVDIELRTDATEFKVGEPFTMGLYAVSATGQDVPFSTLDVILDWSLGDALKCVNHGHAGPYPDDGWYKMLGERHIMWTEDVPFNRDWQANGRVYWIGLVVAGRFPMATPAGLLLYQFTFEPVIAGAHSIERPLSVPEHPVPRTSVGSSTVPGLDILRQPGLTIDVQPA